MGVLIISKQLGTHVPPGPLINATWTVSVKLETGVMPRRRQPISVHFLFKNEIPAAEFNGCSEFLYDDGSDGSSTKVILEHCTLIIWWHFLHSFSESFTPGKEMPILLDWTHIPCILLLLVTFIKCYIYFCISFIFIMYCKSLPGMNLQLLANSEVSEVNCL